MKTTSADQLPGPFASVTTLAFPWFSSGRSVVDLFVIWSPAERRRDAAIARAVKRAARASRASSETSRDFSRGEVVL